MAQGASPSRQFGSGTVVAAALIVALAAGATAYRVGRSQTQPMPTTESAEAGFARDMQVHHIQGVELSMLVRDRTMDEDVRRMAYDMATTQGHQAGQLYGWLAAWGLNQLASTPPMAWMGHTGHPMGALMPGMATPAQVASLRDASGVVAERIFLTLMIAHHRGALEMSQALLARSDHPTARAFAQAVLTSQQAEIDLMTTMLQARQAR